MKFYFNGSPNPTKVALFLEEAGLAYEPIPVDTRKGDQFNPEFLARQPQRQGAGDRRRRRGRCSIPTQSCFTWLKKPGNFCPPPATRRGRSCCRG